MSLWSSCRRWLPRRPMNRHQARSRRPSNSCALRLEQLEDRCVPAVSLITTPDATTIALASAPVTLADTAVLSGADNPTGSIIFTLYYNGGTAAVDTESVPVNGNGSYTTPTGFTLPTTGMVAGTYQWDATYSGDTNNLAVSDDGAANEQVTVSPASPTLTTIASPAVALPAGPAGTVTLSDTAVLSGGYHPGGDIEFTLSGPDGYVYTQTVTVTDNGSYFAGATLPTSGTVAGVYTWAATYNGDANNNPFAEIGSAANGEQTIVSPANPTIATTASPAVTLPTGPTGTVTLNDAALLSAGYYPTGTIRFTLNGPAGFSYTQVDRVSGNGTYTASATLPTTGTVAGIYTWSVAYSGDANNAAASETGTAGNGEQTAVSPASPTLATTASPAVTLPAGPPGSVTLTDGAVLSGGYYPIGGIVFTLAGPNGFLYTQTATVAGNRTYTASATLPNSGTIAGTYTWSATYTGDANNNPFTESGSAANGEQTVVAPAIPTLGTTPNFTNLALGDAAVTLTDTATLAGAYYPTGTITFTLYQGSTLLDSETVPVSGNGSYATPTGYTLPATGTVVGTYQWNAVYSGDANNNPVGDIDAGNEAVTVSEASPAIATTPSATAVTLDDALLTLTDTAMLSGGYRPTGSITFTLYYNGGNTPVDTETVAVDGNGSYTTPAGYTLPTTGTAIGAYQWDASYSGDANNNANSDSNAANEQLTVSAANPSLTTTPSASNVTLADALVTLTDTALVAGYNPTGTITFTLYYNGGSTPFDTETVSVHGNGSYATPLGYTLATIGTVVGSYQWQAVYSGDANNNRVNAAYEAVTVSQASPALSSTPGGTVVVGSSVNLTDSATLVGAYNPTGYILFTLTAPTGGIVDEEAVGVAGNGTYTTPLGYLPSGNGPLTGAYQWTASYSGDANNNSAPGAVVPEDVTPASPTLSAAAGETVALGTGVTLTDSATLAGGFNATGTITFTLLAPDGATVDTEMAAVNGNGTYATPTGYAPSGAGTLVGTYHWTASYGGDGNNNPADAAGTQAEQVNAATPTLTTTPGGTVAPDSAAKLTDTATLAAGFNPGGVILFTLTAPDGTIVDSEIVPVVTGNGSYATANGYAPSVIGTYEWSASYSGDSNNNAVRSAAGSEPEDVKVSPTLISTPGGPIMLGSSGNLTDTATLSGGLSPTGTITFTLVGPNGNTVDTESATVNGNGTYPTPTGYVPSGSGTLTGTYQWQASYGGDSNNAAASTLAGSEAESVRPASPSLTASPSGPVVLGSGAALTDTATVAGGFQATGRITFTLADPTGNTVDTETVTVHGDGTYATPTGYVPTGAGTLTGTYQWTASYSGDGNNNPDTTAAGSQPENVSAASPMLSTTPGGTVVVGMTVAMTDSATLAGAVNAGGTITFTLLAPDGATVVETEMVPVNGNGTYTTPGGYLPTTAGTYQWTAAYSGDSNNNGVSSTAGDEPEIAQASPTLTTTPSGAVALGSSAPLTDSATLSAGASPTGTITFTLVDPAGDTVDTETATVNGNGTYATPAGYMLPALGAAPGTYQWNASYSGDTYNSPVSDTNAANEQVTVDLASPTLTTTASGNVTLGTTAPTLSDTAVLAGGFDPTGSVTFTLSGPNGFSFTHTDTVSGNGTYSASDTLPTFGTVAGTYTWSASYAGDANNNAFTDSGSAANGEQTIVSPAGPAIATTPSTTSVTLGTSTVTLEDMAVLSGGYSPTGTVTFTLVDDNGLTVVTETATVSGNGSYTTPAGYTLPATGTVAGTYQWNVSYSGDDNNNAVSMNYAGNEQVNVGLASPTLTTTPGGPVAPGSGAMLTDSATLSGGFDPTGAITFTLLAPDGSTVETEMATVNGNGTYPTPNGYLPSASAPTGTYEWTASYSGDGNNNAVSGSPATEPQRYGLASPALATTPSATSVTLGASVTLTDTATLSGGFSPTGTVTFTLYFNNGATAVDTETVTVSGNGTYATPTGYKLPATGTVVGTYQWDASYSGDTNNNPVSDTNASGEKVTVSLRDAGAHHDAQRNQRHAWHRHRDADGHRDAFGRRQPHGVDHVHLGRPQRHAGGYRNGPRHRRRQLRHGDGLCAAGECHRGGGVSVERQLRWRPQQQLRQRQ